jgi:outer membrane protein assembly factor BamA
VSALYYVEDLGSDYDYNRYEVDLRRYLGKNDASVFAFHVLGQLTSGTPPFYELPALGGQQIMRGYYEGRYRDRIYLAGQAEYRRHLWWKLGAVAFLGAGNVGHDANDIRIADFKISSGFGLRVLFNEKEKVNLRIDLGFGPDTNGTYFALEEAF